MPKCFFSISMSLLFFHQMSLSQIILSEPLIFSVKNGLAGHDVRAIFQDNNNAYWFGGRSEGLSYYDGEHWKNYTTKDGLISTGIMSITSDENGDIWFAGAGGIQKFSGMEWTQYRLKEELNLTGRVVFKIRSNVNGKTLFGAAGGAGYFLNNELTTFTTDNGLKHNVVHDLLEDRSGMLWFATRKGGLNTFDGKSWNVHLPDANSRALLEDSDGNMWVGTSQNGVMKYDGSEWANFKDGLTILPMIEDKMGRIWFSTESMGIFVFDGKVWTSFTKVDGLISNTIYTIFEDKQGYIWLGSDKGVIRFSIK